MEKVPENHSNTLQSYHCPCCTSITLFLPLTVLIFTIQVTGLLNRNGLWPKKKYKAKSQLKNPICPSPFTSTYPAPLEPGCWARSSFSWSQTAIVIFSPGHSWHCENLCVMPGNWSQKAKHRRKSYNQTHHSFINKLPGPLPTREKHILSEPFLSSSPMFSLD